MNSTHYVETAPSRNQAMPLQMPLKIHGIWYKSQSPRCRSWLVSRVKCEDTLPCMRGVWLDQLIRSSQETDKPRTSLINKPSSSQRLISFWATQLRRPKGFQSTSKEMWCSPRGRKEFAGIFLEITKSCPIPQRQQTASPESTLRKELGMWRHQPSISI